MLNMEHLQLLSRVNNGWLWLIPAFPLLGAILNGFLTLLGRNKAGWIPEWLFGLIGCAGAFGSFIVAWAAFTQFRSLPESSILVQDLGLWMEPQALQARFSFQMDALSMAMVVFITFVSSLIHLYSVGYMKGDRGFGRFFTYMNFFLFSMLVLVMADNLLLLFLGWEGVGFCSYLLIAFWFNDEAKAAAGKKAIIVNRIGDAGFLAGLLLVYSLAGTLQLEGLQEHKLAFTEATATLACLCFFFGAAGKSAQIPLYVWLPDAMAGPTPVSALIHAATMVTAGVYLIARLHFLYVLAPWASLVVAVLGALTALLAASIALAQNDIKKVLAYSTISQLGYMFLGVGVGGFGAGIFHLITHGFFKAALFLGAGSVIHSLGGEQDMRKMGGLMKHLPWTSLAFMLSWMALTGIFPFCGGFFSKDEILWRTLATPNPLFSPLPEILYFIGLFTAFLTGFYMTRLVVMVFFGDFKGGGEAMKHLHESPWVMTLPLLLLAFLSLPIGWLGTPVSIGGGDTLGKFLDPLFRLSSLEPNALSPRLEPVLMFLSLLVALLGVGSAWYVYGLRHVVSPKLLKFIPGGPKALEQKYYVDEIYDTTIVRWVKWFAGAVSNWLIEKLLVNRLLDFLVGLGSAFGRLLQKTQVGLVRAYLAYVALGAALLVYLALR
jgi:NADH-quinone oxidoreductase subunit L